MQEIDGTSMHYSWGTADAIPAILGVPADGRPVAEYWLGAHAMAPAVVAGRRLDRLIASDPSLLGAAARDAFGGRMPFMLKLLSARHALSLQAHPTKAQASDGYARENAAGMAMDDPERSYRDDNAKPEIIVALSDFRLLVGFRSRQAIVDLFMGLGVYDVVEPLIGAWTFRRGTAATEQVFIDILARAPGRRDLIDSVLVAAVAHAGDEGPVGDLARMIISVDEHFPGDPGILAACLMNLVELRPGQAMFIPPGTMHAHLEGTGVEVLANSDNVVRGGLTTKHIAVQELVSVVDFSELNPVVLDGHEEAPGVWTYPSECPEFDVWRIESAAGRTTEVPASGSIRIALVTRGEASMTDGETTLPLECGQAVLLTATDPTVSLTGDAELFVAAPGVR